MNSLVQAMLPLLPQKGLSLLNIIFLEETGNLYFHDLDFFILMDQILSHLNSLSQLRNNTINHSCLVTKTDLLFPFAILHLKLIFC